MESSANLALPRDIDGRPEQPEWVDGLVRKLIGRISLGAHPEIIRVDGRYEGLVAGKSVIDVWTLPRPEKAHYPDGLHVQCTYAHLPDNPVRDGRYEFLVGYGDHAGKLMDRPDQEVSIDFYDLPINSMSQPQ